jgi:hypothetical protein
MNQAILFFIIFLFLIYSIPPSPKIELLTSFSDFRTEDKQLAFAIFEHIQSKKTTFGFYSDILSKYKNTYDNLGKIATYNQLINLSNKNRLTINTIFDLMY